MSFKNGYLPEWERSADRFRVAEQGKLRGGLVLRAL